MGLINRYITRNILIPFALAVTVLFLALSLERVMRLVQLVTQEGATLYRVFELIIYLVPHYLGLAIPAATLFAVMFAFRGLHKKSELPVMQSAGLSMLQLARPAILLACLLAVVMVGLQGYIQPHSRYAFRLAEHEMKVSGFTGHIPAGTFLKISDALTLRANNVSAETGELSDVFIARKSSAAGQWTTFFSARKAVVRRHAGPGPPGIVLHNGNMMRIGPGGRVERLFFSVYPLDMGDGMARSYGPRGQDEREKTLAELSRTAPPERAALHIRLIHSLSVPVLALLAIPLALLGRGRGGRAYGIIGGIILLVGYEKILSLGQAYVENAHISPLIGLWGPFAWLCALTAGLWLYLFPPRYRLPPRNPARARAGGRI